MVDLFYKRMKIIRLVNGNSMSEAERKLQEPYHKTFVLALFDTFTTRYNYSGVNFKLFGYFHPYKHF